MYLLTSTEFVTQHSNQTRRVELVKPPNTKAFSQDDTSLVSSVSNNNEEDQGPQRAFPVYPYGTDWCSETEDGYHRGPTDQGFLYMKEFKTGSSTLAGVSLRIVRNVAMRKYHPNGTTTTTTNPCKVRAFHVRARKFRDLIRSKSFLWSVIRDPTKRLVSKFFHFRVSRDDIQPSLENMQEYFRTPKVEVYDRHYYLKSLSLQAFNPHATVDKVKESVKTILNDYDFLGITERLDESLVVLQLLLGLETGDMLYLSAAKTSGTYEYWPAKQGCILIQKNNITADMNEWLEHSKEFQDYIFGDVLMYKAVQKSLDLTIQKLGREMVDRALMRFKWAQEYAKIKCAAKTKFPCTSHGEHNKQNDCIRADNACGYTCLDQVQAELQTLPEFNALPPIQLVYA
jgi:hypothetical protein